MKKCQIIELIPFYEFQTIVISTIRYGRVNDYYVRDSTVYLLISSESGASRWRANITFYCEKRESPYRKSTSEWVVYSIIESENDQSNYPYTLADIIADKLAQRLRSSSSNDFENETSRDNYNDEQEKERRSKSINTFFVVLIIMVIAIAGCIVLVSHIEDSKMIEIGVSSDKLLGMKYETVESILKDNGFTNIELRERNDIDIKDTSDLSKVINVSIRGKSEFNETDLVPYDSRIVVVYHNVKKMAIPLSHEEAKKKNADDLLNILHNSGFVNIEMVAEYDLLLGWFNKDRSVISVTIDGNAEFSETEEFYQNAPIVIKYHTFIKDKK